jgi:hypothetical protein
MTTIAATVVGIGSAGSITAFVASKLRSSIREQDPPKTDRSTLSVDTPESTETRDLAAGGAHAYGATCGKKTG